MELAVERPVREAPRQLANLNAAVSTAREQRHLKSNVCSKVTAHADRTRVDATSAYAG